MRRKVYIKEDVIKNKLNNFFYSSGSVDKKLYAMLLRLGLDEDQYIAENYNDNDSSFDCIGTKNSYSIRLGSEYANKWKYPTIEITNNGMSVNYFYYLDEELNPRLLLRDYTTNINEKKYTEILNYSPDGNERAYIRKIEQDNKEVFFYIDDPKVDYQEFDKILRSDDFKLDWKSMYTLLKKYEKIDKYLAYYKEDGQITDLASYGFPIEEIFHYYENSEEEKTKVRIKKRD